MKRSWWHRFQSSTAHTQANIVCTIVIAIATCSYAFIAYRQLKAINGQLDQMSKQLPEIQKSAQAARDSADIQARLIKAEYAARIIVSGWGFEDATKQLSFQANNSGKIPSGVVLVSIDATVVSLPALHNLSSLQNLSFSVPTINPQDSAPARYLAVKGYSSEKFWSHAEGIRLDESWKYEDGLGDTNSGKQCIVIMAVYSAQRALNGWACDAVPEYIREQQKLQIKK